VVLSSSGNRGKSATDMSDPPGPPLFDDVCGVERNSSGDDLKNNYGEWTPTDFFFRSYTDLLQDSANPRADAAEQTKLSESQSSQASAAEGK
jgi:hypothetical protein